MPFNSTSDLASQAAAFWNTNTGKNISQPMMGVPAQQGQYKYDFSQLQNGNWNDHNWLHFAGTDGTPLAAIRNYSTKAYDGASQETGAGATLDQLLNYNVFSDPGDFGGTGLSGSHESKMNGINYDMVSPNGGVQGNGTFSGWNDFGIGDGLGVASIIAMAGGAAAAGLGSAGGAAGAGAGGMLGDATAAGYGGLTAGSTATMGGGASGLFGGGLGLSEAALGGAGAAGAGAGIGSSLSQLLNNPMGKLAISQILGNLTGGSSGGSSGSSTGNNSTGTGGGMGDLGSLINILGGAYGAQQQGNSANEMKSWLQGQQSKIDNLYNPNTPEYNALWDQMSRKDAAAGRNSQYGPRSVDMAARIAQIKADETQRFTSGTSRAYSDALNQNASKYSGLLSALGASTMGGGLGGASSTGLGALMKLLSGGTGGATTPSLQQLLQGSSAGTANDLTSASDYASAFPADNGLPYGAEDPFSIFW